METKEELRRKFDEHFWYDGAMENTETRILVPFIRQTVFEFLWKEIEAREKELIELSSHTRQTEKTLRMEIYRLEATLEAADEVMKSLHQVHRPNWVKNTEETYELIEKYNQLKAKK